MDSSPDTIRLGFIGAGSIFKTRHLPGLKKIAGVGFAAVCNRSQASGQAVADEFGIESVETDWRKVIARDDIDAICIGTWPYTHRAMSIAALEAGKHVFCQARMAGNLDDARAMVVAAEEHPDLVNMICPPPHRMPWEPWIKKTIANELGEIRCVRVISVNGGNADPERITWREQVEYSGKQALQVGIWAETLNAWLGEYDSLCATTATPIGTKTDAQGQTHEIRIPQIVLIHGTLRNGAAISEVHSGLSLSEKANYVVMEGSRGTLRVDAMERVSFAKAGQALTPVNVPADLQRDWRVEADFIDAVRAARQGKPREARLVSIDFAEGLRYMRKVEAVARAAEACCAVRLAEL